MILISTALLLPSLGLLVPEQAHATDPTAATAKIVKITQNSVDHTSASDIANLPWAANSTNSLDLTFRVTNTGQQNIYTVCVQPSSGSATLIRRISLNDSYGADGTLDPTGHYFQPYTYSAGVAKSAQPDNTTVCYTAGSVIASGGSADIVFKKIYVNYAQDADENITWTVTTITNATATPPVTGLLSVGSTTQYEQAVATVDTSGTLTQTLKAPVVSLSTAAPIYANSNSTLVYNIINPTAYTGTTVRFLFAFDGIDTDSNFDFPSVATELSLHTGDGTVDSTSWGLATSGPAGSSRYITFTPNPGITGMSPGQAINFSINFKIGDLFHHTSRSYWLVASDTTQINNFTSSLSNAAWSSNIPWSQYGFAISSIATGTMTQNTQTTATVTAHMYSSSSAVTVRANLSSATCGVIGPSDPLTLQASSGDTLIFSFPVAVASTTGDCTFSAFADSSIDAGTTWTQNVSNTLTVASAILPLTGGGTGTGTGTGTDSSGNNTTTPQSGPSRYSFLSQMSTSQKIEYSIILLAFLTLICAGAYQHGPAISAKFKQFVSKR